MLVLLEMYIYIYISIIKTRHLCVSPFLPSTSAVVVRVVLVVLLTFCRSWGRIGGNLPSCLAIGLFGDFLLLLKSCFRLVRSCLNWRIWIWMKSGLPGGKLQIPCFYFENYTPWKLTNDIGISPCSIGNTSSFVDFPAIVMLVFPGRVTALNSIAPHPPTSGWRWYSSLLSPWRWDHLTHLPRRWPRRCPWGYGTKGKRRKKHRFVKQRRSSYTVIPLYLWKKGGSKCWKKQNVPWNCWKLFRVFWLAEFPYHRSWHHHELGQSRSHQTGHHVGGSKGSGVSRLTQLGFMF